MVTEKVMVTVKAVAMVKASVMVKAVRSRPLRLLRLPPLLRRQMVWQVSLVVEVRMPWAKRVLVMTAKVLTRPQAVWGAEAAVSWLPASSSSVAARCGVGEAAAG